MIDYKLFFMYVLKANVNLNKNSYTHLTNYKMLATNNLTY